MSYSVIEPVDILNIETFSYLIDFTQRMNYDLLIKNTNIFKNHMERIMKKPKSPSHYKDAELLANQNFNTDSDLHYCYDIACYNEVTNEHNNKRARLNNDYCDMV